MSRGVDRPWKLSQRQGVAVYRLPTTDDPRLLSKDTCRVRSPRTPVASGARVGWSRRNRHRQSGLQSRSQHFFRIAVSREESSRDLTSGTFEISNVPWKTGIDWQRARSGWFSKPDRNSVERSRLSRSASRSVRAGKSGRRHNDRRSLAILGRTPADPVTMPQGKAERCSKVFSWVCWPSADRWAVLAATSFVKTEKSVFANNHA